MMKELCGTDCCKNCDALGKACAGCAETGGNPFGGGCVASACVNRGGIDAMRTEKETVLKEINALGVIPADVTDLFLLNGNYVNLAYPLASGQTAQFLDDKKIYWANQIEVTGSDRCFGIVADESFILICTYGCNGADPELVLYKAR